MAEPLSEQNSKNLPPLFLNYLTTDDIGIVRIFVLTVYDFFEWWYIEMPILIYKYLSRISVIMLDQLSIGVLMKNFLTPWHRHKKPIGYFMGIVMRILYLPIALFIYASTMLIGIIVLFGWILLPILTVIMIFATPLIS